LAKLHIFNVFALNFAAIFIKIFGHKVGFWPQKWHFFDVFSKNPKNYEK
jgi:hypothetical protein